MQKIEEEKPHDRNKEEYQKPELGKINELKKMTDKK